MLNKEIEAQVFQWEMKGIGEIAMLLDAFNFAVKTKRYFLNGYLHIDKQLHVNGAVEEDKFFINYVKRDLKKKGINIEKFRTVGEFRQATQGIFFHHFGEIYNEILSLLDACRYIPFFILTESEVDVLDEKLTELKKLETDYIVHADILLNGESYSGLLFSRHYEIVDDTFTGKVEKILHTALHADTIFTLPQKTVLEHSLTSYLDVNQRKLEIDAKTNLAKIKFYAQRYESLHDEFNEYLTSTNTIDFFDISHVLSVVNSEVLPLVDKVKILTLIVKDVEKNLQENLVHIQSVEQLHPAYQGLILLIVQTKLVINLNRLAHDFYCGELTQLIKLELLKISIIHHFLHK